MSPFESELAAARVLPVLRAADARAALAVAERLVDAGHRVLEFTATTAAWADAVAGARRRWPGVSVGAGTLRSADDARAAILAGAAFLVSPFPAPDVRAVAERDGVPLLEGGFTPAELAAATARGPAKLFPAHVGGPAYLRSLLAVLPGAAIVPTGGVQPDAIDDYLQAGALAVGLNAERLLGREGTG
jgi:2-dehydro-3-deoxyphosphogluconate aldolase/(4S)-4-hydroxy-2-oxoglutarate aldolase